MIDDMFFHNYQSVVFRAVTEYGTYPWTEIHKKETQELTQQEILFFPPDKVVEVKAFAK